MPKKDKKSGGLTSIPGGLSAGGGNGAGGDGNNVDNANATIRGAEHHVIDLTTVRAQRSKDTQRNVERYFLHHMIDAFCEIEGEKPFSVEIIEASETGCSFRVHTETSKRFPRDASGALAPIRAKFYFSRDSYLLVGLNMVYITPEIGTGGQNVRIGCQLDEAFASTNAFRQFVRFIEAFSQTCMRDGKFARTL